MEHIQKIKEEQERKEKRGTKHENKEGKHNRTSDKVSTLREKHGC